MKCYCAMTNALMWGGGDASFVSACDGREKAIAKLLPEQRRAEREP